MGHNLKFCTLWTELHLRILYILGIKKTDVKTVIKEYLEKYDRNHACKNKIQKGGHGIQTGDR